MAFLYCLFQAIRAWSGKEAVPNFERLFVEGMFLIEDLVIMNLLAKLLK